MPADALDRALETPAWFTSPVRENERKLIIEIERLELPWHWQRWDIAPTPPFTTERSTYGVIYADVGYLPGAAPKGCVPVHTRADIQYAWGLYLAVQRQAHEAPAEPAQLTLELAA